ncbi:hypothetical protein K435DRAFT_796128, partial [Dendrothele bispora CBS 962.96]
SRGLRQHQSRIGASVNDGQNRTKALLNTNFLEPHQTSSNSTPPNVPVFIKWHFGEQSVEQTFPLLNLNLMQNIRNLLNINDTEEFSIPNDYRQALLVNKLLVPSDISVLDLYHHPLSTLPVFDENEKINWPEDDNQVFSTRAPVLNDPSKVTVLRNLPLPALDDIKSLMPRAVTAMKDNKISFQYTTHCGNLTFPMWVLLYWCSVYSLRIQKGIWVDVYNCLYLLPWAENPNK